MVHEELVYDVESKNIELKEIEIIIVVAKENGETLV